MIKIEMYFVEEIEKDIIGIEAFEKCEHINANWILF